MTTIRMITSKGVVALKLRRDAAPETVEYITKVRGTLRYLQLFVMLIYVDVSRLGSLLPHHLS